MKIITQRDLIKGIPAWWRETYASGKYGQDKIQIMKLLDTLDVETATVKDISDIIGNDSWTSRSCDECQMDVDVVIQLGQEPDYESNTVEICRNCFKKALDLIGRG
jgi:hypothetical protein